MRGESTGFVSGYNVCQIRRYWERPLRFYGYVERLLAEDPAYRILSCRDPEGPPACFVFAPGGVLSERHGHVVPRVCLGDDQTEAEGVPSHGGCGDALLQRMPPYLT